jgi:hypothetical protein
MLVPLILSIVCGGCGRKKDIFVPESPEEPLSPPDGDTLTTGFPSFDWVDVPEALFYGFQVDDRESFSTPLIDDSTSSSEYTPTVELEDGAYYWRMRARGGSDEWSPWSPTWTFVIDTNPYFIVGESSTTGYAHGIYVVGNYAYLAVGEAGCEIFDISDPASPSAVGRADTPGDARRIAVHDDYAYLADEVSGVATVLISDPAFPERTSTWDPRSSVQDVFCHAPYLFVVDRSGGLVVLTLADPASPVPHSTWTRTQGMSRGVAVDGSYAYIADGELGLQVVDVSQVDSLGISHPIVGTCDTPGYARDLFIDGAYCYIADGKSGLTAIDISDPENPRNVSTVDTPGYANSVHVLEGHAYVADWERGVQVIDVGDPQNPQITGGCETDYAQDVFATGDYIYVADNYQGLIVIGCQTEQ